MPSAPNSAARETAVIHVDAHEVCFDFIFATRCIQRARGIFLATLRVKNSAAIQFAWTCGPDFLKFPAMNPFRIILPLGFLLAIVAGCGQPAKPTPRVNYVRQEDFIEIVKSGDQAKI